MSATLTQCQLSVLASPLLVLPAWRHSARIPSAHDWYGDCCLRAYGYLDPCVLRLRGRPETWESGMNEAEITEQFRLLQQEIVLAGEAIETLQRDQRAEVDALHL